MVSEKFYLYKYGDEIQNVTGGWTKDDSRPGHYLHGRGFLGLLLVEEGNDISNILSCSEQIDLTNYSTLVVNAYASENSNSSVYLYSSSIDEYVRKEDITGLTETYSIDVTDLTEPYYIGISCNANSGAEYSYIKELYLLESDEPYVPPVDPEDPEEPDEPIIPDPPIDPDEPENRIYLFENGDEKLSVTGGWSALDGVPRKSNEYYDSMYISKDVSNGTLKAIVYPSPFYWDEQGNPNMFMPTSGIIATNNTINLTDSSSIVISAKCSIDGITSNLYVSGLYIIPNNATYYETNSIRYIPITSVDGTFETYSIDNLSDVTGSYRIGIGISVEPGSQNPLTCGETVAEYIYLVNDIKEPDEPDENSVYLFKALTNPVSGQWNGDECISRTGGWNVVQNLKRRGAAGTTYWNVDKITQTDSHELLVKTMPYGLDWGDESTYYETSGIVATTYDIELTNYSQLVVKGHWSMTTSTYNSRAVGIYLFPTDATYYENNNWKHVEFAYNEESLAIDLSDVEGRYRIGIGVCVIPNNNYPEPSSSAGAIAHVNKIYLVPNNSEDPTN